MSGTAHHQPSPLRDDDALIAARHGSSYTMAGMHNRRNWMRRSPAVGLFLGLSVVSTGQALAQSTAAAPAASLAEKFQKARTLSEANRCAEASPLLRELAEHPQAGELAPLSANLLLDCDNRTQNEEKLEQDAEKLCSLPSLRKEEHFRRVCAAIESGLARRKMELLEKAGDFRKAAELALAFVKQHPDAAKLDELYYNAAVLLERSGDHVRAQRTRTQLLATYADSPLSPRALYTSCQRYAQIGASERAAWCWEEYARRWPSAASETEGAFMALQAALRIRIAQGDTARAQQDLDQFLKLYGNRQRHSRAIAELFLLASQMYENPSLHKQLEAHLRKYLQTFAAFGGVHAEIIATTRLAELLWQRSCPVPMFDGICLSPRAAGNPPAKKLHPGFVARAAPLVQEVKSLCTRVLGLGRGLGSSGAAPSETVDDPAAHEAVRIERARNAVARVELLLSDMEYERAP